MLRATSAAPEPARLEGRRRIQGADAGALGVIEHRMIHCAGKVIQRKLRRASHVDALGKVASASTLTARAHGVALAHRDFPVAPSRGLSAGHTLSSSFACAAITGWMRSGWNMALSSAKPSNRNGTSAALRSRATSA